LTGSNTKHKDLVQTSNNWLQ